jgi:hypothetical protein
VKILREDEAMDSSRRARCAWILALVAVFAFMAVGCIPAGTYTVSSFGAGGVPPGLYHSLGPAKVGGACDGLTSLWYPGSPTVPSYLFSLQGPAWVEISPQDPSFQTEGCFPFWQEPGPFARPLATPGQPFGPGTFKVGYEIAPGRYRATGGTYQQPSPGSDPYPACTWFRKSSFRSPDHASTLQQGRVPEVTIEPGDFGFESWYCGTWTKVG